jgi:uncharacterized protein
MNVEAVALWPGAGSSADHPSLVAIERALDPLPTARFDFPYRREGRRAPDRANKLIASLRTDVAGWCAEVGTTSDRVVLGGRSMGARMASMAAAGATGNTAKGAPAAEEPLRCAGLVLIGYPLHPPGRPENLRTAHLPALGVPVLSVAGDRDPFGAPEELAEALALVAGPVSSVTIPGARHELAGADDLIAEAVGDWIARLSG